MTRERCDECGFDGDVWTDAAALIAIADLPTRWSRAVTGLQLEDLLRRPVPGTWSIAEYVDHVREVLFGMRFVLDSAVAQPGADLGEPPEALFSPEPRVVEIRQALDGIAHETRALLDRFAELSGSDWTASAGISGDRVDAHWIVRHALHDATHHLLDVDRLRTALSHGRGRDATRQEP